VFALALGRCSLGIAQVNVEEFQLERRFAIELEAAISNSDVKTLPEPPLLGDSDLYRDSQV